MTEQNFSILVTQNNIFWTQLFFLNEQLFSFTMRVLLDFLPGRSKNPKII